MKRTLKIIGLSSVLAAGLAFSAGQHPDALLGGWKTAVNVNGRPVETTIFLKPAGACTCRLAAGDKSVVKDGTWSVAGNILSVEISGQVLLRSTFEVQGDILILDGGAARCVRVDEAADSEEPVRAAGPDQGRGPADLRLPTLTLRPNVICGYVVNAMGRPIGEDFGTVRVHAWTRGLHGDVHVNAVPDRNGYYEMKVEEASWYIDAALRMRQGQDMLVLELRPLQTRADQWPVAAGVRMDFVWSLSGVKPDMAGNPRKPWEFYGLHVTVERSEILSVNPQVGDTYVFRLVPTGPLLDGTAGRPVTREWKHEARWEDPRLADIPLGTYVLEGRLVSPGGASKPLKFREAGENWWDRIEIKPEADNDGGKLKPIVIKMAERDRQRAVRNDAPRP